MYLECYMVACCVDVNYLVIHTGRSIHKMEDRELLG